MKNFMILTKSINYIENNLCESITRSDIARHCYVSLSLLEKIFRYALCMSIKDYISRRRITQATREIVQSGMSITDIAMKYQYNSIEVFSRAFKRVWNINPSEFKENWKFTDIFPKINFEFKEGEDMDMVRKKVDISEAYDFFKEKKGSYVLCFDIQNMTGFNNISFKAGDLAILEMAKRLNAAAGEDMIVMRIGSDEFAIITGLYDEAEAKNIMNKILERNGEMINYENGNLPVSLWCGITQITENLEYNNFFDNIHNAINESKSL